MFFIHRVKRTARAEQKQQIFERRPLLKDLILNFGKLSLLDFTVQNLIYTPKPSPEREREFLESFEGILTKRLDETTAKEVTIQLKNIYAASTADHHGTLNSSLASSSNLMFAAAADKIGHAWLKYTIVLSCASISLNNEDYPRGILFHSLKSGKAQLQKLSLLPSNNHNSLVYGFRPYTFEEVQKIEKALREKQRNSEIEPKEAEKIHTILNEIYKDPKILNATSLCDQFTQVNHKLWGNLFKEDTKRKGLIYVDLETLATELLIKNHLKQSSSLIHRMIFDTSLNDSLLTPLTLAMEEFLRQGSLATHLFWWVNPEKNTRIKLQKVGDKLATEDGRFSMLFTPQSIEEALKQKSLMPNLLLIYTLIHLYYGFNCLGGFNQMHYLESMRKLYNESTYDPQTCQANSTLYNYGLNTLFLSDAIPALHLDIALHGQTNFLKDYQDALSQISLEDAFDTNWPIIYDILYPSLASTL